MTYSAFFPFSVSDIHRSPDFSLNTEPQTTCCDTIQKVTLLLSKIVLFPWALHDLLQYATERTIMALVYPAQSSLLKILSGQQTEMQKALNTVDQMGLNPFVKEVVLERNGIKLHGWIICKPGQEQNKNWVVQAVGNNTTVESYLPTINTRYANAGFNTLLLNNPGVGHSEGTSTPQTIGEAQDLAMIYVESLGAKKIAFAGHSLGGAAMGLMTLRHAFKSHIKYLGIPQVTFDTLSNVVAKTIPSIQGISIPAIAWTGLEMDTLKASRRLHDLQIRECVINAQENGQYISDKVIPARATLGYGIANAGIPLTYKQINYPDLPGLDHFSNFVFVKTAEILKDWNKL